MCTNRSTTLHIYVHNEVSGLSLMSYSTMANVIEFQNLPIHIHKNLETMYNRLGDERPQDTRATLISLAPIYIPP